MERHIVGYIPSWKIKSHKKKLKTQTDFEEFLYTNNIDLPTPHTLLISVVNKVYFHYTENNTYKIKDVSNWRFWFKDEENENIKYLFNILDVINC